MEISDDELVEMGHVGRAELLARLAAMETPPLTSPGAERRRHRMMLLMTFSTAVLVPWILVLSLTLPRRYVIERWAQTWVGFDVALIVCLAVTTWSGWQRRQLLVPASVITATLLICDAWFDVMTAAPGHDLAVSSASALFLELPLAGTLLLLSRRLTRLTLHVAWLRSGTDGPDLPLRSVPLFGLPPASTGSGSLTARERG